MSPFGMRMCRWMEVSEGGLMTWLSLLCFGILAAFFKGVWDGVMWDGMNEIDYAQHPFHIQISVSFFVSYLPYFMK